MTEVGWAFGYPTSSKLSSKNKIQLAALRAEQSEEELSTTISLLLLFPAYLSQISTLRSTNE